MTFIPKCFYDKKITSLINSYIQEGCGSYDELDDSEKENLTSECINILGDDAYTCIIEPQDFSKTIRQFSKYLKTADMDEAHELLNTMKKNAIEHYADYLNQMFLERIEEISYEYRKEKGFLPTKDMNTGELLWEKRA